MATEKECPICGDKIPRRNRMYCSQSCWKEAVTDRVLNECECCGKTYEIKRSKSDRSRFCSKECQTTYSRNRIVVECQFCGDEYEIRASRSDSTRFCSRTCKDQWKRSQKNRTVERSCAQCGATVKKKPYVASQHENHFCDDSCRGQWMSENQCRNENPNWKGGATHEFGKNWPEQRKRALQRDERCQVCGSDGSDTHLDVHHIVPRSEFDEVEHANTLLNLVLLCRSCHKMAEHGTISCPHPEILGNNKTNVVPRYAAYKQIRAYCRKLRHQN